MRIARMGFNRGFAIQNGGISMQLMTAMLALMPIDSEFIGCGADLTQNLDYLFFTSSKFIDTPNGSIVPDITPHFRRLANGQAACDRIDFGHALQTYGSYNAASSGGVLSGMGSKCSSGHNWQTHIGLRDSYDYCQICGIRRNP